MAEPTLGASHVPLRDLVTEELRRRILTGVLGPGTRLVEDRLAGQLGVSRNPVREAIRVLATEGLVEVLPRRGAAVARPERRQAEELFEIRIALEGLAARLAARHRTPETAARLRTVLDAARPAVAESATDARAIGPVADHNTAFHVTVARISGNGQLDLLVRPLLARAQWVFVQTARHRAPGSWAEHAAICDAITAGDEEAAGALATAHVAAARRSYLASLRDSDQV